MTPEQVLRRITLQDTLLAEAPKRLRLLKLDPVDWPLNEKVLRVHRNHAFEFIGSLLNIFSAFDRTVYSIKASDYDDSLSFSDLEGKADIELFWLDYERYSLSATALQDWLTDRIDHLRGLSHAPLLIAEDFHAAPDIAPAIAEIIAARPGVYGIPLGKVAEEFGAAFIDQQRAEFQGTAISGQAQVRIAQDLALKYLPATLKPRIKAIAIDLDNTLYRGVLGEDGPEGIELTEGHRKLQEALVALGEEGVLLSIVSKNEASDVAELFSRRDDFPLRAERLAGQRINWHPKAENIRDLAAEFNIAPEAFLFLDDNPGELVRVAGALPDIDFLHAREDASQTVRELGRYPKLFAWTVTETDRLRANDIAAAARRRALAAESAGDAREFDRDAYLRTMETSIELAMKPSALYARLCSIPVKTNQFNLSLSRLGEVEVEHYLKSPDAFVVAFSLKDKLSDSGNVGALYAHIEGSALIVDELCVSCRALGRGIEDIIIGESLSFIRDSANSSFDEIRFKYRKGPRNGPALKWLSEFCGARLEITDDAEGEENGPPRELVWPAEGLGTSMFGQPDAPVAIVRKNAEIHSELKVG